MQVQEVQEGIKEGSGGLGNSSSSSSSTLGLGIIIGIALIAINLVRSLIKIA